MEDEKRLVLPQEIIRRPICWDPAPPWIIHWDPIPPWVKLDEKMQHQFAQMELKFMKMELDIRQQKLAEIGKIVGAANR